jgi:hypothetical protein
LEWRPEGKGRDNPANEAREKSRGEKDGGNLAKGNRGSLVEVDLSDSNGTDGPEVKMPESEDSELFVFAQVLMISSMVVRGDPGVLGTNKIIEWETPQPVP